MPAPNPADIAVHLPEGAYDVTVADFVARWKTPNRHLPNGYADARFLAATFLAALRAELPALKSWTIQDYDGSPASDWSDRACLTDGTARLWASVRGYGANAFSKVNVSGWVRDDKGKTSRSVDMSAALNRPVSTIARDVARRVLPELDTLRAETSAKAKADIERAAIIEGKAEQLAKRYPNLRISPDVENHRVYIASKYGAGFHLDCYTYPSQPSGGWRLTSERGTAFSCNNIDTPSGRAFLKLCNDS